MTGIEAAKENWYITGIFRQETMTSHPLPTDSYQTLSRSSQIATKVQGSRFLGFADHVDTPEAAMSRWKTLKEQFFDATHHCFAYRIGLGGEEFRMNDDGEPSGAAGKPIFASMEHRGITDALVVVVRYYGGTKLGIGGLVRAYGEAANAALAAAGEEQRYVNVRIAIGFGHEHTSAVMRSLQSLGATIVGSRYDESAHHVVQVRMSLADVLRRDLVEGTRGGVCFENTVQEKGGN